MDQPRTDERLFSGYTGRMFVTLGLGWMVLLLGRELIPPLLPVIIDTLSITPARAGFALTLMWGLTALSQYPGGRLSDQLSRTTVIVAGLAVVVLGFLVLASVTSYATFLLGTALVGLGIGWYHIPMRAFMSDLFVDRRGQAFGISGAAGSVGSTLAGGVAVAAIALGAWRAAFLPSALLLVLVVVALHRWSREQYVVTGIDLDVLGTGRRIFRTSRLRSTLVAYSLVSFTWQGVVGFLPTFLQAEKGFTPALAGASFALLFLTGMVAMPVAGRLGDRARHTRVAGLSLALSAVGILGAIASPLAPVVIASIVVFAAGQRAFVPVMQAHVMGQFPDGSMGGDFGAFRSVYIAVGSLGPTYVGIVAEQGSYVASFVGSTVCLLVATAIVLRLPTGT